MKKELIEELRENKISLRGRSLIGEVLRVSIHKTATVVWSRQHYLPKYERYEKRYSNIKAHKPACLEVKTGDKVKVMECRPLSKTKHFVIVEVVKDERIESKDN